MTPEEIEDHFKDFSFVDILRLKAPEQAKTDPWMCSFCHETDHKHSPMIFVSEDKLVCHLCGREDSLKRIKRMIAPFGVACFQSRLFRDGRPIEDTLV